MRDINVKVSLNDIADNLNINDLGQLALSIQKKHFDKKNKKDTIEYILNGIKDVLIHGENYEIINSSNFIEFILVEYIDKNLLKKIDESIKSEYKKVLKLSNCLNENNDLINDLREFIEENKYNELYDFDRIRSYIYDSYYDNRKQIQLNIL